MEPTGERTVPGIDREQYFFARHEAVYRWIRHTFSSELSEAVVLDAGSGEGYGAAMLSDAGPHVVLAVEYDEGACQHSATTYRGPQVVRANLAALPIAQHSIDVTVSLQVIEHLWELPRFLSDLISVTRPGGLLVVSTPNREKFSPGLGRGERPLNPFHVEEFDAEQVRQLLGDAGWTHVDVLGLHHGSAIADWEAEHGSIVTAQVAAISTDSWSQELSERISGIAFGDFAITSLTRDAEDLIAVGRAPMQRRRVNP